MPKMKSELLKIFRSNFILFILLLKTVLSFQLNSNENRLQREHSLIKPYYGSGMTIPYWDFLGVTMVTNNYIRLTPDERSQTGAIWNTIPCNIRNWELLVHFKVHGKGKDLFGDGLAIWYVKDRMRTGPVFGSTDFFHGLGILIDTYSNHNGEHNHQHPFISAMVNNGTLHYDHDRDGTHTQLAGCEANFRNVNYDTHILIKYEFDKLTVLKDMQNKGEWKECFVVNGVRLPTGYYFGISAATGDLSDNHDLIGVRLFELESDFKDTEDRSKIIPSAATFEQPRARVDDAKQSMSGFKLFILLIIGCISIVVCIIIGLMLYQKHKEKSRKRFY